MSKKGLTLVELLVAIAIMALILLVVLPTITTLARKLNEKSYEQTVSILEHAAKAYVEQIDDQGLDNIGDSKVITLQDLVRTKLIDAPFINPRTKEQIPLTSTIRIIKVDTNEYNYELPL